jgi:PAS domain S-box-containing protein
MLPGARDAVALELSGADPARAVIAQTPDALIFADRDGTIRLWTARAEAMFGHTADEAIGQSLDLIIPPHLREAHWRGYQKAIATGHTRLDGKPVVTRAAHKNGAKLYVELGFGLLRDHQGNVLGALATGRPASRPGSNAT